MDAHYPTYAFYTIGSNLAILANLAIFGIFSTLRVSQHP